MVEVEAGVLIAVGESDDREFWGRCCGRRDWLPLAAFFTICLKYLPYKTERPFRCFVTDPILSRTPAASTINLRTLGASADPSVAYALRVNAKQAAKDIMMAVLLGIDCNCDSP